MTTLNLGNLATFRLVVQRGSFSAAAGMSLLMHGERIEQAVSEAVQSVQDYSQSVSCPARQVGSTLMVGMPF